MRRLSALDLAFFLTESDDSPKHVGGLMRFAPPPRSGADFGRQLIGDLMAFDRPTEPFNLVIRLAGLTGPHWRPCEDFEIERHLFYHRPRKTSSWRQVEDLVARLHEPVLDRAKPLWEYHLIDGIRGGDVAVYFKVHHAYADGMTMMTWLQRTLSGSESSTDLEPVWAMPGERKKAPARAPSPIGPGGLLSWSRRQLSTASGMAKLASQQLLERAGITNQAVPLQFDNTDRTPLTGSASPGRSIATARLGMEEVKSLCATARATLNHIALACIDGALHRYLAEIGCPLDHPVTIQMPVNLRRDGDDSSGNRVGVALVELAEPEADPVQRLQQIGYSLRRARNLVAGVSGDAMQQYTVLSALTIEAFDKLGLSDRVPATGHTLVSNVPGPTEPLFMKGARLKEMYPISVLVPGLRTNITLFSCCGVLNFGIVATRNPARLYRLAEFIEAEFRVLQEALPAG
jgi:WS/DGAT/MGAT family acyltransferase